MTTRDEVEAFKANRLWAAAADAVKFAEEAVGRSVTDRQTLARVVAVGKYVRSYRPIEPYLFLSSRIAQADALTAQFDAINSQLAGWDRDAAMLTPTVQNVDANCDQILAYLYAFQWPTARKGRGADAFVEASDAYRVAAENSLLAMEQELQAAREELDELSNAARELESNATLRENDAEDALKKIQSALATLDESARQEWDVVKKELQEAAQDQREGFEEAAHVFLASLKENYETGNDLVKKVADQSVGGEYLAFAGTEQKAYRLWSGVGIGAGIAAFLYLAIMFYGGGGGVEGSVLKVGISLTLVALSVYAFREAGKRLRQSVEARYRAMDVIAMPPFSRDLSDTQKASLRYLMGERLFGASAEQSSPSRGDKSSNFNLSVDSSTVKAVTDAVKTMRDG